MPTLEIIFVYPSSSVAIKKGNNEGITLLAHKRSPDLVATRLLLENTTKQTVNKQKSKGKIFLFKERNINLGLLRTTDFIKHSLIV